MPRLPETIIEQIAAANDIVDVVGGQVTPAIKFLAATTADTEEFPPPTPAPPELIARATALVERHPQCFWFWRRDARIQSCEDVRLVIEHLRGHGDSDAWREAQKLHQCLSPIFKRKS